MFRRSFWLWLVILATTWFLGLLHIYQSISGFPTSVFLGTAVFFAVYFAIPLFLNKHLHLSIVFVVLSIIATLVFWHSKQVESNPFILIIFLYLIVEAVYRLPKWYALVAGALISINLFILGYGVFPLSFLLLFIIVYSFVLSIAHENLTKINESETRYEALLHEYRKLKRRSLIDEKIARQEERTQIGREIHDSVGHKLTNLLMQLEVARMESSTSEKGRIELIKDLAKESLEETRRAVKAMKQEDIGGLSSIIQLIRKLEAEHFIRIQFSVKNRAFSANLNSEQSVSVYRAVQEALTNVMRHSPQKEATVLFESPGESIFRFEVTNPIEADYSYVEGFGLTSMRERVEQAGGTLEILTYQNKFIVRGTFPLSREGGEKL